VPIFADGPSALDGSGVVLSGPAEGVAGETCLTSAPLALGLGTLLRWRVPEPRPAGSFPVTHESFLRRLARLALDDGKLPRAEPARMWGGPGTGEMCAVCDLPISAPDLEYELQYDRQNHLQPGLQIYRLHLRCFAVWELERTRGVE
jgi:hypothetical protein